MQQKGIKKRQFTIFYKVKFWKLESSEIFSLIYKTGKVEHCGFSKEKFCQQNFHYTIQVGVLVYQNSNSIY
ncbi:hypothetical protein CD113_00930 [Staphylococcus simiae]|nr:hypothetical protein CD113_00930 [Staphylococcus simiae]